MAKAKMDHAKLVVRQYLHYIRSKIHFRIPTWLQYGAIVLIALSVYYKYLNSLYAVEEVYMGDKLRELTIDEMFTIRVQEPTDFSLLKRFVEKYSLCQHVYEIQIQWRSTNTPPVPPMDNHFTFAHTHSRVVFDHSVSSNPFNSGLTVGTEGMHACTLQI
jgi:hypothetical protein